MKPHPDDIEVVASKIVDLTLDIKQFEFCATTDQMLPGFAPGSHVVVTAPDRGGYIRNVYTLTSDPRDLRHYSITVMRRPFGRGGSLHLHDNTRIGDRLFVRPPLNYFGISRTARRHLLIAGGIGITPFATMLGELAGSGADVELHYASRTRSQIDAFEPVFLRKYAPFVQTYVSERNERVDPLALLMRQPLGTHVYVCGPRRLIDAVVDAAKSLDWPLSSVHVESFQAPIGGNPFTVEIAGSGQTVTVKEDESILDALECAGVKTSSLCRMGVCGRCKVVVHSYEGQLLHRDRALSAKERSENSAIIACVSRITGRRLVVGVENDVATSRLRGLNPGGTSGLQER
jgi:ferredoxin-NADP reductase